MTKAIPNEDQIRETAYLFWLDDGQPQGRDEEHWLRAVDALTKPVAKERAARKTPAKPRAASKAKKTSAPKAARAAK